MFNTVAIFCCIYSDITITTAAAITSQILLLLPDYRYEETHCFTIAASIRNVTVFLQPYFLLLQIPVLTTV